jgi:hypothetical protein
VVLQRVNNAVSAAHWEEQAQTPGEASGVQMKTLAGEREAVFNTPLPPGTRAAARREPQEVLCCACAHTDTGAGALLHCLPLALCPTASLSPCAPLLPSRPVQVPKE